MKEFKAIVNAYRQLAQDKKAALATVVKVHGSSYRSPGARMLITDDGHWVGSISGGCLEGDALRKARKVMQDGTPLAVTYDTREESNQNLGIGLGCNGVIDVLIEPLRPEDPSNPVLLFEGFLKTSTPLALATGYSEGIAGQRILIDAEATTIVSTFNDAHLAGQVEADLREVLQNTNSAARCYQAGEITHEIYVELIQPSISLVIFGGGFDARPVSALAKSLGWDVTVTDECVAHIAPSFFPTADQLSLCHREVVGQKIDVTPYTACVLMSHSYEYDRDILKGLLGTDTPYIGILGPRKRFDRMVGEFTAGGIRLSPGQLRKIHSPIGIDIGAEAPDEIAVSIIAEIQSKFTGRSGGFLKYRSGPIHVRDREGDQVFKHVYLKPSDEQKSASR